MAKTLHLSAFLVAVVLVFGALTIGNRFGAFDSTGHEYVNHRLSSKRDAYLLVYDSRSTGDNASAPRWLESDRLLRFLLLQQSNGSSYADRFRTFARPLATSYVFLVDEDYIFGKMLCTYVHVCQPS